MTSAWIRQPARAPAEGGDKTHGRIFKRGPWSGPREDPDITRLLYKRKGTAMDMANADVEIIRKVMGKDGDQEKKRGIVYTLILEVEKLGMNMHPDESKAIYVRLAEALASSKFFEPMVKEALAGRRDYERRLESYKSSIDGIGAAKAFKALAEASADDVAILMAMLVRGAKNAFDDAEEYMGKSNLYELVFGFAHVLLNHEGRAHARQVRESELGPKIRDFLRSEQ